jgi:predicted phosphodiesterase
MKIQVASDLHLDINRTIPSLTFPLSIPENAKAVVLILAGDFGTKEHLKFAVHFYSLYFKAVIFVLGNHEFYGDDFLTVKDSIRTFVSQHKDIYFLDNESIEIEDTVFYGSIGWAPAKKIPSISKYVNDFRYIKNFSTSICQKEHEKAVDWVETSLTSHKDGSKKSVLITHFGFSEGSIAEKYKGDPITPYFINPILDNFSVLPDVYVHGHTHEGSHYMLRNKTEVICNPFGYRNEHGGRFNPALIIDLDECSSSRY